MKIAFVVQRYGKEVNGGAELHCRRVAERLNRLHAVDVLTTCAIDYQTWKNSYKPGISDVDGVRVRRFPVDFPRHNHTFANSYNFLVSYQLWLNNHHDTTISDKDHIAKLLHPSESSTLAPPPASRSLLTKLELALLQHLNERFWMQMQGPFSSELISFLRQNRKNYDAFFFFTYNYGTTYYGLPIVKKRAALIPTVHEEACISFSIYKKVFKSPRYILFNTLEEKLFTEKRFPFVKETASDIVGLGVDLIKVKERGVMAKRYGVHEPFLLYIGRIEPSKGCALLFESFIKFRQRGRSPLKLLLLGKAEMPIPDHPDIIPLGFVDEETKTAALQESVAFVMPSFFESLSMAILEAWLVKTPVLVNEACTVLAAHCERSKGGLCFHDEETFAHALLKILDQPHLKSELGQAGYEYVKANYNWDRVIGKYQHVIEKLTAHS